jgi:hypothetical protein
MKPTLVSALISPRFIIPFVYISFLSGMAVAYIFRDRYNMRKLCVGFFIICLLIPNIAGIHIFPFVNLQKYTYAADDTVTQYQIRVVDEQGQEIRLDPRAVEPIRPHKITDVFAQDYSQDERDRTFRYIFEEARSYREYVQSRPPIRRSTLEFPDHDVNDRWTDSELEEYDAFTAVRIYKVEKTFINDNAEVVVEREQVYEWSQDGRTSESDI